MSFVAFLLFFLFVFHFLTSRPPTRPLATVLLTSELIVPRVCRFEEFQKDFPTSSRMPSSLGILNLSRGSSYFLRFRITSCTVSARSQDSHHGQVSLCTFEIEIRASSLVCPISSFNGSTSSLPSYGGSAKDRNDVAELTVASHFSSNLRPIDFSIPWHGVPTSSLNGSEMV